MTVKEEEISRCFVRTGEIMQYHAYAASNSPGFFWGGFINIAREIPIC